MLKRNAGYLAASLLTLASLSIAGEHVRTFHGEISDSGCAMNVHSLTRSHQEMLKSKGMGGTSGRALRTAPRKWAESSCLRPETPFITWIIRRK